MFMRPFYILLWLLSLIPLGLRRAWEGVKAFARDVLELMMMLQSAPRKRRRRWFFKVKKPALDVELHLSRHEIERLLKRARELQDVQDLTGFGLTFRMGEKDFYITPEQAEETIRRILDANPPFLYMGRVPPEETDRSEGPKRRDRLRKRERVHVQGYFELLVPEDRPIVSHSDVPPGNQSLRPAMSFRELPRATMIDRVLPPLLQIERLMHGDLMVLEYARSRANVEFIPRQRYLDYEEEREVDVEVELETVDPETSVQLIYFLLDTSASMQGTSATLAAAVFCAIHRANMAVPARYFMRTFADYVEPGWDQPPWIAETLTERERLYEKLFTLNFNGNATHTGWALEKACSDIAEARERDPDLSRAVIVLITDGRSELLPGTIATVIKTGAPLHTIMVSRDRNADLERISDSFTTLAGLPEVPSGPSTLAS